MVLHTDWFGYALQEHSLNYIIMMELNEYYSISIIMYDIRSEGHIQQLIP